jgi:DivIVA domain-containing protein
VPLDRQTIEKKDFPIGRRGYDVDAVDAHLRLLAEEVEELKRSSRRRPESLAAAASEGVQAIVAAAETAAAKIQGDAENEATEIRREARNEAAATREEATSQAGDYVSKVSDSTTSLLAGVDAIEQELSAVVDSLRSSGKRIQSELGELEGSLGEVKEAVSLRSGAATPARPSAISAEHEPAEDDEDEDYDDEHDESGFDEEHDDEHDEPVEEHELAATGSNGGEPAAEATTESQGPPGEGESEADGARLIALNMALNGAPREEVDRYLAENFELSDRNQLIEEVYAAIED